MSSLEPTQEEIDRILDPETKDTIINVEKEMNDLVKVYFGCGCFWHVQHEFVIAE